MVVVVVTRATLVVLVMMVALEGAVLGGLLTPVVGVSKQLGLKTIGELYLTGVLQPSYMQTSNLSLLLFLIRSLISQFCLFLSTFIMTNTSVTL